MRANIHIRNINDSIEQEWLTKTLNFINNGDRWKIEQMVSQYREGQACKMIEYIQGAFNYCIRIRFDDDNQEWMLRSPKPGSAMQRTEKVYNEFAVMRFVAQHTTIPVPRAIACGVTVGELAWLGPYIIMEFVQGESLDEMILDNTEKMKSKVSEATLSKIFRQIANILLQLSLHDFDKIGSLTMKEHQGKDVWSVDHGP